MERPEKLGPKRVWLPEEECERMNRAEFEATRCLLGAVSYAGHAMDGLQKRLKEYGLWPRMAMVVGGLKAIADDVIGTTPRNQCLQLKNTMQDMEMRMVPKLTPMSQNVLLEASLAKGLIEIAREQCKGCVEDEKSCLKCSLYKVLVGFLPLDTYNSGMICPYSLSEWKD